MKMPRSIPDASLPIATADGEFLAIYSSKGLAELRFPGDNRSSGSRNLTTKSPTPENISRWHQLTTAAVHSILRGEAPNALPPLDLAGHSDFQRNVWSELLKLMPGQTLAYGELAARVGVPSGARAVGTACGANPIPLIIPCHRILAADGGMGGFSGGLDWKRRLLREEGLQPRELPSTRKKYSRFVQEQLAIFERQPL